MPTSYAAIGTTLAGLANIETAYGVVNHALDGVPPLTGLVRRRALSGRPRHDGAINEALRFDVATRAQLNAFMNAVFAGWETPGAQVYVSLLGEDGYYSPWQAYIEKPSFTVAPGGTRIGVEFPLWNLALQSVTKTGNATITTAERLVYGDTTSGSVTLTLPAAASVTAYTVYSFVKTVAANSLVLDGNASETIDGATTKTLTAQYARADIYSTGSAWLSL